jgi:hypothetical protein
MANKQNVKKYLAHWFQLGKKVIVGHSNRSFLPNPVLQGDRYSLEFEECWQEILALKTSDCYLEGTKETIAQLLTPAWELLPCGRCSMPVPVKSMGLPSIFCPCYYLSNWPNNELPPPRPPVNTQEQLTVIRDRLLDNLLMGN